MPMLQVKLTNTITLEENKELHQKLTQMLADTFNKEQAYIMVSIEGNQDIWMGSRQLDRGAYIMIYMMGNIDQQKAGNYTKFLCDLFKEKYDIPGDDVYIIFQSIRQWGGNGAMF